MTMNREEVQALRLDDLVINKISGTVYKVHMEDWADHSCPIRLIDLVRGYPGWQSYHSLLDFDRYAEGVGGTIEERAAEHALELLRMLQRVDSPEFDCDWQAVQSLIQKVQFGV
jgi:hypothetical protein